MKNLEAVVTGPDPVELRAQIARCCEAASVSDTTHAEIAASCAIPPRENGLVLNFRIPDCDAMRVVHAILCTFGAADTGPSQPCPGCRLISIGILKDDLRDDGGGKAHGASLCS